MSITLKFDEVTVFEIVVFATKYVRSGLELVQNEMSLPDLRVERSLHLIVNFFVIH